MCNPRNHAGVFVKRCASTCEQLSEFVGEETRHAANDALIKTILISYGGRPRGVAPTGSRDAVGAPQCAYPMIRTILIVWWVVLFYGFALPAAAQDENDTPSWCVSVWYPSSEYPGGFDSVMQNADLIDTINPFWYSPRPDGTLATTDPNAEDEAQLTAMREAGFLIMPAIFSSVSMMIEDETIRAKHIDEIVALVERMAYDGIDIDYEGFGLHTREPFSTFIEDLADALHERGKLLSIAVHPKTQDAAAWDAAAAQDWSRIAPAVDVFRIMTYDYHSRNEPPGTIGPPTWAAAVLAYAQTVTDLSKVRLGLHFYGYSWQRGTPPATAVTWESTQRLIESFNPELQRDDMELFIDLKVRGLPRQTIYVADAAGIEYKLAAILEAYPTLGGVAIWGLGGEDPANWDVLQRLDTGECQAG